MSLRNIFMAALLLAIPWCAGGDTSGDGCQPEWEPKFGLPGMSGPVNVMAIADVGTGPALYAGGFFTAAGNTLVSHIAKWNGVTWEPLGSGMSDSGDPIVSALVEFNDGTGPALYAGGAFRYAGGVEVNYIAKWDGSSWHSVGGGMDSDVYALAVFDDGSGPKLYAGGIFSMAGGTSALQIACWDGVSWSAVGGGTSSAVNALFAFDDGSGPALYAGGSFVTAGGVTVNRIAKWDGAAWSALSSGMTGKSGAQIHSLAAFDTGNGPTLYAGGYFDFAGGVVATSLAQWDGTDWAAVGSGVDGTDPVHVTALATFDGGGGAALFAGGNFTLAGGQAVNKIARWDGTMWAPLEGGLTTDTDYVRVLSMRSWDDGSGARLFVGGTFQFADGIVVRNLARWTGSGWSAMPVGQGLNGSVHASVVFDDGTGDALYVAGGFTTAGNIVAHRIARWDGSGWQPVGEGFDDTVDALAVFDDGFGPALYAGGHFTSSGSTSVPYIAKWDGTSWISLEAGMNQPVYALHAFDDGSGPALFAGGAFTEAGEETCNRIAKWDGVTWHPLGDGANWTVFAVTDFDDGSGPGLFIGGDFTIVGFESCPRVAKWDGAAWFPLGAGMNETVRALAVFDDGSGESLYAGGEFLIAGGISCPRIARWSGAQWSSVGGGANAEVTSLLPFDDGAGTSLFVGGSFTQVGSLTALGIAEWNGTEWAALGSGFFNARGPWTMTDHISGDRRSLFCGGSFVRAGGIPSFNLAIWQGCRPIAQPAVLTDVAVTFGALISGTLDDLLESDDSNLRARSRLGFVSTRTQQIDVRVGAMTAALNGSSLDISVEGRISQPGGTGAFRLRNWSTNSFEQVHTYLIGSSEIVVAVPDLPAANRIRQSDGRIELVIRQQAIAVFSASFDSFTDHVVIAVE